MLQYTIKHLSLSIHGSTSTLAMVLQIAQLWVMKEGKDTWIPQTKVIDGIVFGLLDKWDHGLVKVLTGKALDLRKNKTSGTLNTKTFDELFAERQIAFDRALALALQTDCELCELEDECVKKKKQKTKRRQSQQCFVPMLSLHCKGFTDDDGDVDPVDIKVLSDDIESLNKIWIELSVKNMTYIQRRSKLDVTSGEMGRCRIASLKISSAYEVSSPASESTHCDGSLVQGDSVSSNDDTS